MNEQNQRRQYGFDQPVRLSVGYMLWVMKSGKKIPKKLKKPFDHIRHGNYHDFIQLIKGGTGKIAVYTHGDISLHTQSFANDFSLLGMIKANDSLRIFHFACKAEFGSFSDPDLPGIVFEELVIFELGIRMHADKEQLTSKGEDLQPVISKVAKSKGMSSSELQLMQRGKDFLNAVKHPKDLNRYFSNWSEGRIIFNEVIKLMKKYELTIF